MRMALSCLLLRACNKITRTKSHPIFGPPLNLETAVGSQKSAQALGAPDKIQKCLITTEVTTTFCIAPCTPISYTSFLRPTAVSRLNAPHSKKSQHSGAMPRLFLNRYVQIRPKSRRDFVPVILLQALIFTVFSTVAPIESLARRNALTPDQREHLRTAQDIRIQALALTEKGPTDSDAIQRVISDRLHTIGLTVVERATKPHDVELKVKCEERRSSVAMTTIGGDADQPGAPSRLWKGPACQLTYSIDGQIGPWRQEVRTPFEDAWQAAKTQGHKDSGL